MMEEVKVNFLEICMFKPKFVKLKNIRVFPDYQDFKQDFFESMVLLSVEMSSKCKMRITKTLKEEVEPIVLENNHSIQRGMPKRRRILAFSNSHDSHKEQTGCRFVQTIWLNWNVDDFNSKSWTRASWEDMRTKIAIRHYQKFPWHFRNRFIRTERKEKLPVFITNGAPVVKTCSLTHCCKKSRQELRRKTNLENKTSRKIIFQSIPIIGFPISDSIGTFFSKTLR